MFLKKVHNLLLLIYIVDSILRDLLVLLLNYLSHIILAL